MKLLMVLKFLFDYLIIRIAKINFVNLVGEIGTRGQDVRDGRPVALVAEGPGAS